MSHPRVTFSWGQTSISPQRMWTTKTRCDLGLYLFVHNPQALLPLLLISIK